MILIHNGTPKNFDGSSVNVVNALPHNRFQNKYLFR